MQPTLLQTKTFTTASNLANENITLDSPVQAGSIILVGILIVDPTHTVQFQYALDSAVSIYSTISSASINFPNLPDLYMDVAYPLTPTAVNGSYTIRPHFTGTGARVTLIIREYCAFPPGFNWQARLSPTVTSFDSSNYGTGTDTNANPAGFTVHRGDNLLIGVAVNDGALAMTQTSNFGNTINVTNGTYNFAMCDRFQGVITLADPMFNMPSSANWASGMLDLYIDNPMYFAPGNVIYSSSTSNSISATYTTATKPGSLLYASVYSNNGSPTISGWNLIKSQLIHGTSYVASYWKLANGTESTVTASGGSATNMKLHIFEIQGNANPVVIDGTPISEATSTVATQLLSTATLSTTAVRSLLISSLATEGDGSPNTYLTGQNLFRVCNDLRLATTIAFISGDNPDSPIVNQQIGMQGASGYMAGTLAAFDAALPVVDPLSGGLGTTGVGS